MSEVSSLYERFLRTFKKGDLIFEEGGEGDEMFIVHLGRVGIVKSDSEEGQSLATLEPGDFFGEMALIDGSPRSASAIAEEDETKLIVLDKPKFTYMVQQVPDFSLAIMAKLCRQIRETNIQRVRNQDG
ncbi:cyclic nucleotide-binding domain-containing protein [Chloroflexota bacterium]